MMLKMKLREALELLEAIKQIQKSAAARKIKFAYMLAYNRRVLETMRDDAAKSLSTEEETKLIQAFEVDRVNSLKAVAEKSPAGEAIVDNDDTYRIPGGEVTLKKIQNDLETRHPGIVDLLQARADRERELLNETQEFDIRKLNINEWPDMPDDIDPEIMNTLFKMIED